MMTSNRKLKELSENIRRIIDGQPVDLRDNREGVFSILKNDIHTLATLKNEQVDALQADKIALKETLADISHQLKTPLTSMLIMVDLLETAPPEKQAKFIDNIRTSLTHTDWLVSALLKMAKLDAGAVEFTHTQVSSSEIVRLALEPLQILLDVRNQSVSVDSTDITISCDCRWTAEALTNILKNASEYSPVGGVITVNVGSNPICSWVSISDSGSGIANSDIPKLFKRYKGSRNKKGYGVGLPLSLAIMHGQNGDIEVNGGSDGSGASFTLKFYK
jgi:signal transduction histidine kinase